MAVGEPFELDGDNGVGVVCIHGFTGTPQSIRYLGDRVHAAGYTVHAVRLPGHGTTVDDLDRATWQDWATAVEDEVDTLRLSCDRVAVVGQSLGGLLALHTAARRPDVAAVATLAAPIWLEGLGARVARAAEAGKLRWLKSLPKLGGADVRDRRVRRELVGYRAFPLRATGQLAAFMRVVDGELADIRQPVLVLHAEHDHVAPVACASHIAERTHAVRTRILPRSYHLIAVDVERDIVAAEVIDFLRRHAGATRGDVACAT
ncbi:MAG TPA: alpha/beta fold hydrolase [Kofleriaceae bacterium]